eukprot:g1124.t1
MATDGEKDPKTRAGRPFVGTRSAAALAKSELDDYLQHKKIETLFSTLAADLLVTKPKHPITHMCRYLKKKYPKQFQAALQDLPDDYSDDEDEDGVVRTRLPMTPNERMADDKRIAKEAEESSDDEHRV